MNESKTVSNATLEAAIESLGWRWLCDSEQRYRVGVFADLEHGNLETEYWLSLDPQMDNTFLFRLYGNAWFLGAPESLREACDTWNLCTSYPKACLFKDDEGDTRLVLEWAIPCFDEPVSQTLVNGWVRDFSQGCACFLERWAELLSDTPRYTGVVEPGQDLH